VKKTKDQIGGQVYRVEKLRKDYGRCPVDEPLLMDKSPAGTPTPNLNRPAA
jgi:hypothetical protein